MRRPALYSRSSRLPADAPAATAVDAPEPSAAASGRRPWRRDVVAVLLVVLGACLATMGNIWLWRYPPAQALTQDEFDAAVQRTLESTRLPSQVTRAAQAIAPSVVQVVAYGPHPAWQKRKSLRAARLSHEVERGIGTGVVVMDKGVILTNLHVVSGASRIQVTFHDGLEATALLVRTRPEKDLAVLQAKKIPDDLLPATLHASDDLLPGDLVAVVGFPFGVGPSVSAGVVSGLGRAFHSPEGQRELNGLIQFDAATNPGNSGGPLINMDGEVVGIVTAILNPTQQQTFIGIGFAVPIESAASAAGVSPF